MRSGPAPTNGNVNGPAGASGTAVPSLTNRSIQRARASQRMAKVAEISMVRSSCPGEMGVGAAIAMSDAAISSA